MKIVMAIKALNNAGGGAERVFSIISSVLAEKGHEIIAISFDNENSYSFFSLNSKVKRISIDIGDTNKSTTIINFFKGVALLRRECLKIKPDVIVGFMHSMYIPLGISLIGTKIPLVASEHTVYTHFKNNRIQKYIFLLFQFTFKYITVVSEQAKLTFPSYLHKKILPITNPVEIKYECMANTQGRNKQKTILAVGSLTNIKNHKVLIEAFSKIENRFPDWNLKIVGDGELKKMLIDLIENFHLENRVFLMGNISPIDDEYIKSQLFVIPSIYESFSLVTAEALAYGLPAIGFVDCPGVNKLIKTDVNGLLVSENNRVSALANAMNELMENDQKRKEMGEKAVNIRSTFNTNKIIENWELLISKYSTTK